MNDFIILLIEYFRHYNVWFLGLLIILQFNGIPVGANFVVIASGVLAYSGEFNILSLLGEVWLFTILGDSISFFIWQRVGQKLFLKFPLIRNFFTVGLQKSEKHFARHGKITILLTRFPVSVLGPVVNITAGTAQMRFSSFLAPVLLGDFVWTVFNLGVGYMCGDSWEEAAVLVNQFGWLLLFALCLLAVVFAFRKVLTKRERISVELSDQDNDEALNKAPKV